MPSYGRELSSNAPFVIRRRQSSSTASIRSARPMARSASSIALTVSSANQYPRASWCSIAASAGSSARSRYASTAGSRMAIASAARQSLTNPCPSSAVARAAPGAIAHLVATRDRIAQQRFCLPDVAAEDGGLPRPLEKLRDLRGVVGDFDRLDQEPHRLVVAAERAGTRRRGPEGDLRLRRQRPAVGIVRRRAIRRQIVRRKRTGQLVLAQRLEEPGRSQVARPTVAPGEGAVRDLADERLDERHLAALGRPRVDVLDEQFPPRERPAQLLHLGSVLPARGREPVDREALAEDGRILDQAPFRCRQRVEASRDQGVQRLRHGQVRQVARRDVAAVGRRQSALGDQHPDRLDRVQRDAVGAFGDRSKRRIGKTRNELGEQLADGGLRQWLEAEGHEVPPAGTPVRSMLEQLRTGDGDDRASGGRGSTRRARR